MTTMTEPTASGRTTGAATILQRAVCLTLSRHYIGNDRQVDLDDLVAAAAPERGAGPLAVDKTQFHSSRKLIDPKELRPVRSILGKARSYLQSVAVAGHQVFGDRTYLVARTMLEEVDARLSALAAEVYVEAAKLADRYEAAVERQRLAQGPLFKASDYLTPERVRTAFSLDWDYISFEAPNLETVNHAIAARVKEREEARLSAAFDEVVAAMRGDALKVVSELADRLGTGPDGKLKVLRPTVLAGLQDYLALLPKRNIAGDDALPDALARIAKLSDGLAVSDLRDSDATRAALLAEAGKAAEALAGLVEDAPRRAVAFGRIG